MKKRVIKTKLPDWLSQRQKAELEAGFAYEGSYSTWFAVEGDDTACGVKVSSVKALALLNQAIARHKGEPRRWAFGSFDTEPGAVAGSCATGTAA